jgi:hypothetical protein
MRVTRKRPSSSNRISRASDPISFGAMADSVRATIGAVVCCKGWVAWCLDSPIRPGIARPAITLVSYVVVIMLLLHKDRFEWLTYSCISQVAGERALRTPKSPFAYDPLHLHSHPAHTTTCLCRSVCQYNLNMRCSATSINCESRLPPLATAQPLPCLAHENTSDLRGAHAT